MIELEKLLIDAGILMDRALSERLTPVAWMVSIATHRFLTVEFQQYGDMVILGFPLKVVKDGAQQADKTPLIRLEVAEPQVLSL